ncbi:MAG: transposase [Treponema sp.]|jgi:putative transposase|nr:transposase [Treponema sp.]
MRKKREIIEGAAYHVTSRTNGKIPAFENDFGRKIMLITLQDAKEKYGFRLHNFCIMPTHIHLLLTPAGGTNLSRIMQWIKTHSAKRWNCINRSENHFWGERFFARQIKDSADYSFVQNYIDQNPVKAGLVPHAPDWESCGAYYIANGISGFIDEGDCHFL